MLGVGPACPAGRRRTSDVRFSTWRFVKTPPLSGEENMLYDATLLRAVEAGNAPPTIHFFRFSEPTVTYGRLQKRENILTLVPPTWPLIQRPTGGGMVLHHNDLCLSLVWPKGMAPLP